MRKLCATLFGWVSGPNADGHSRYRRYQHAYVALAKKNGKALAHDTRIPTVDGWKLHGDLVVGDKLFDRHGKICEVVHVHPELIDDETYEVSFSNGQKIVCHGNHEWVTECYDKLPVDKPRGTCKIEGCSGEDLSANSVTAAHIMPDTVGMATH